MFVYPAEENFSHAQRWSWSGLEEAQRHCRDAAQGPEKRERGATSLGRSPLSAGVRGKELHDKFLLLGEKGFLSALIFIHKASEKLTPMLIYLNATCISEMKRCTCRFQSIRLSLYFILDYIKNLK